MGFSMDDVMEIIQIVKESQDMEVHIDTGDIRLSIFRGDTGGGGRNNMDFSGSARSESEPGFQNGRSAALPESEAVQEAAPARDADAALKEPDAEGLTPIRANVTSVFYRKPSPEEPPFVEVGDMVGEDTVVCLLEVMKCFRQVTAGVKGRVEKICAESNSMVEEGTILFLIQTG